MNILSTDSYAPVFTCNCAKGYMPQVSMKNMIFAKLIPHGIHELFNMSWTVGRNNTERYPS